MANYGWEIAPPPATPTSQFGYSTYKPPKRPKNHFHKPRPKPPTRRFVVDPLAPMSDDEQQRRARAAAQAQFGPLVDQIRAAIEARSQAGQSAIKGYTGALAGLLGQAAPQTGAAYNQAIGQQSQVNNDLANRLTSFGQNTGAELASKLDYAPASTQSNLSAGAVNTATGTANANAAIGAADITRLISESAHGQEYENKLPGVAGLSGLQHAKDLERQLNADLVDQLANASDKAQDTFAQLYLHYQDTEFQKALARQSGQFKSAQAEADARYKSQQIAFKKAELAWKRAKGKADRQQRAAAANQRTQTSRENSQRTAAQREADRKERAREADQRNKTTRRGQDKRAKGSKGFALIPPKKKK